MKILLIGPGLMSIPPEGHGAIEILIWQHARELHALGHHVDIFNTRDLKSVVDAVNEGGYDFIHCHYDPDFKFFLENFKASWVGTSHYGYFTHKEQQEWHYYFKDILHNDILKAPGLINLSPEIDNFCKQEGFLGKSYVLRNGAEVEDFRFEPGPGNGRAICVGKIEPRKRQTSLLRVANNLGYPIDFVGPVVDKDFHIGNGKCQYLGAWNKDQLHERLTNYSVLILASKGEASPLVIPEGLAAGLSIIATESASANLDRTKSFIHICPDDIMNVKVNDVIKNNYKFRSEIRDYAEKHFSWSVIAKEYVAIAEDFIAKQRRE